MHMYVVFVSQVKEVKKTSIMEKTKKNIALEASLFRSPFLLLKAPCPLVPLLPKSTTPVPLGLSARRVQKTKSRGAMGLLLNVGPWKDPLTSSGI